MQNGTSALDREIVTHDNGKDRQIILEQMERILASAPFRHSRRYPVLLRYVVEKTLRGEGESLKERTVGVDAFQREPDYDTNIDPVVRVTAGEVRKRIAQYYYEDGREDELRIDLPPGSYVPTFSLRTEGSAQERFKPPIGDAASPEEPKLEPVSPAPHGAPTANAKLLRTRNLTIALIVIGLILCLSAGWFRWLRPASSLDPAWGPFFSTTTPVLITIGEPSLAPSTTGEPIGQAQTITVRDHLSKVDYLVFSDVQALGQLTALLDRKGWPHRLQAAGTTSFADMRQGPAILIGGLDNPWTLRALSTTRFRFARDGSGVSWIEDQRAPGSRRWSVDFSQPYAQLTEDYAIVARFIEPDTGRPVMVVAGVGENGTKAASEFMTDPAALRVFSGNEQNVEVVLGTTVVKGVSGPPRVLARFAW